MEPVRIPTRADDPPHLLMWSADEILPLVGGLGLGIVLDQVLICVLAGSVATNLYKRFRDLHPATSCTWRTTTALGSLVRPQ